MKMEEIRCLACGSTDIEPYGERQETWGQELLGDTYISQEYKCEYCSSVTRIHYKLRTYDQTVCERFPDKKNVYEFSFQMPGNDLKDAKDLLEKRLAVLTEEGKSIPNQFNVIEMPSLNSIENIANYMVKYNSGASMCDSGDAYGRHWEINKNIDMETVEPFEIEMDCYGDNDFYNVSVVMNTYKLLITHYTDDICEEFNQLTNNAKHFILENFTKDGNNTYNGDAALTQHLLYHYLGEDFEGRVIVQVHTGCDIRGGYSEPFMFQDLILPDIELHYIDTEHGDERTLYSYEGPFELPLDVESFTISAHGYDRTFQVKDYIATP
jgi:DNA-directed RNA polymerase subunit RPC12/RpoP